MTNNNIASSSRQIIAPKKQWQRSTTPTLRLFSDEEGNESSPVVFDSEDSEEEGESESVLFGSNGSLFSFGGFPLPPTTAPNRLHQARSLTSMSNKYYEIQQQKQQESTRQSPLRERRCKKPLTIKATLPPMRMPIRRTRSSSSMVYSPPPCPPPTTPLPDLPLLPLLSGNDLSNRRMAEYAQIQSPYSEEHSSVSFDGDSSGEWMQKTDRSNSPTPSSTSSNSTTPSSSRGNSQRRCEHKAFSSTPPTSDDNGAINRQTLFNWSEQLSLKLGHAFALHLSSPNSTESEDSSDVSIYQDTNTSLPSNEVHVYGFAM